ncbi:MAG: HD domain-containing protein [Bacteroidales bacterium]|nr:HD domain-containing protein [Bacteroidales bacterium]
MLAERRKHKILNDPVYGFINLPEGLIVNLIDHPYFQRLRRIKQLGLTHLVYPGALHTRFHHSIGAMHLMTQAIGTLRYRGHEITPDEETAAQVAILLHDVGHGPFSHALEHSLVKGTSHEQLSLLFMKRLDQQMGGALETGIRIFTGTYPKRFLSQLVSSQLDMDRLDYLTRDSFFTGVSEGIIGTERIIKMLDVFGDDIVAEAKGIYSIEKFLIARRLMYWQVYLHKTVVAAEQILIRILRRAAYLRRIGDPLFATPYLDRFLADNCSLDDFSTHPDLLDAFGVIDDFDILTGIKVWTLHPDRILSTLSRLLVERRLFRCLMQKDPFDYFFVERIRKEVSAQFRLAEDEIDYFIHAGQTSNEAYDMETDQIKILHKDGRIERISEASGQLDISMLSKPVIKHFLCFPKNIAP